MFRKPLIIIPGPGQESVWDYPRPPKLEETSSQIKIEFGGKMILETKRAKRVLETSHPPVYYFPKSDIQTEFLRTAVGTTFCEWKGVASYYDIEVGNNYVSKAAWCYTKPTRAFEGIKDYIAFYPSKMDRCDIDDELIVPQPGDFYGGWITSNIVGPFKGEPGTGFW